MQVPTTTAAALLTWALLLCGCAGNMSSGSSERLLAAPPPGWTMVYQFNQGDNRISEFVPAGEDPLKWINKVTFESFASEHTTDPIDLLLFEVEQYQKKCNFVQHFNLFSGLENNYPTSLRLVMCGKSKVLQTGEVTMLKAVSAEQNYFLIRITRKVPAFEPHQAEFAKADIAQWSVYLSRTSVCDTNSPAHPCATPAPE